jgi:hypothetical protein
LSKAIYDGLISAFGVAATPADDEKRKDFCDVIATSVVNHIVANADVRVTTGDAGLQRADVGTVPNTATLAPSADVVLTGAVE